jgi:hypothetical protein
MPEGIEQRSDQEIRQLARKSADSRRERDLFGDKMPQLPRLLLQLGLQLRSVPGLQVRGMLSRRKEVVVRDGLSEVNRRFVILHEVGHAVLLRDYPDLADQMSKAQHEEFAFHFAASLFLTETELNEVLTHFCKLDSPLLVLEKAKASGFPLAVFLQIPRLRPGCLENSNNVWLRCKYAVNKFTGADAKLRIISAQYDWDRWYLPSNKGLEGVLEDTTWLSEISIGREAERNGLGMVIQRKTRESARKFATVSVRARVRAAALSPTVGETGVSFLLVATIENP